MNDIEKDELIRVLRDVVSSAAGLTLMLTALHPEEFDLQTVVELQESGRATHEMLLEAMRAADDLIETDEMDAWAT